jgi:hypothetical protein
VTHQHDTAAVRDDGRADAIRLYVTRRDMELIEVALDYRATLRKTLRQASIHGDRRSSCPVTAALRTTARRT